MKRLLGVCLLLATIGIMANPASSLTQDTIYLKRSRGFTNISTVNINSGKGTKLIEMKSSWSYVLVSPDEQTVAYNVQEGFYVYNNVTKIKTLVRKNTTDSKRWDNYAVEKFLPDGRLLYGRYYAKGVQGSGKEYANVGDGGDYEVWTYSPKTKKHEVLKVADGKALQTKTMSPDGKYQVAFDGTKIKLTQGATTKEITPSFEGVMNGEVTYCLYGAFSPKSTYLVVNCQGQVAVVINPSTSRVLNVENIGNSFNPVWIDEDEFASHHGSGPGMYIYKVSANGDITNDGKNYGAWNNDRNRSFKLSQIKVRGNDILYIVGEFDRSNTYLKSRLYKYNRTTNKKTLILTSEDKENLTLL